MDLASLWRRLSRGSPSQRSVRSQRFRPCVEALEDRLLLADRIWVGPNDGVWSNPNHWNPNGVPQPADTVIFTAGVLGANTRSKMDLGGGVSYHIAGLETRSGYTSTITLQSNLYVDVLEMFNGTITSEGNQWIAVWQQTQNTTIPATKFGTSRFFGGVMSSRMFAEGEDDHRVTLVLSGGG